MATRPEPHQLARLERRFEDAVRALIQRTLSETDYRPTAFIRMVNEDGALAACRQLLAEELTVANFHEGLTTLWEIGRLDLSVERLVAFEQEWAPLFSDLERDRARRRLNALQYTEKA